MRSKNFKKKGKKKHLVFVAGVFFFIFLKAFVLKVLNHVSQLRPKLTDLWWTEIFGD